MRMNSCLLHLNRSIPTFWNGRSGNCEEIMGSARLAFVLMQVGHSLTRFSICLLTFGHHTPLFALSRYFWIPWWPVCILSDTSSLKAKGMMALSSFIKADLDGTIFAYNYRARLAYIMTFDHPQAHDFHLRHPNKILQAMLRKWPTSGSCRPWLLTFYVKKEGRNKGKGKFGNGIGYKEDGEKVHLDTWWRSWG